MANRFCFLFILLLPFTCPNAKEYSFSPAGIEALKELLASEKLQPGDVVVLEDGIYNNLADVYFGGKGTPDQPITWKARTPGKAVVSGKLKLRIFGEYLQIEDLLFHKAWAMGNQMIDFQNDEGVYASHCRFTNCAIDDCNDPGKGEKPNEGNEYWVNLRGYNNRVDHCYFANKRVGGIIVQVWLNAENHLNNHSIDHNFFGFRQPYGGNGAEIIRIGHSWSSQLESRTVVEDNVFFKCDGENEIISVKSGHNIIRRNLFYESRGGLVCRHGHYNVLESNTFVGNGIPNTAGIRIINQGHVVYDNYIKDVADFGLLVRMGVFEKPTAETDVKEEPLTSYHRVENVDISYNQFIDCSLVLGTGYGELVPRNVRFANNFYTGEKSQVKVARADEVLPGFLFRDNLYSFENRDVSTIFGYDAITRGFSQVAIPDYDKTIRERILNCSPFAGPLWYVPMKKERDYILNK